MLQLDLYSTASRQPGQGGSGDTQTRDLREQLLRAEASHFSKTKVSFHNRDDDVELRETSNKRQLEAAAEDSTSVEDADAKRRRILEETRDIDADSDGSASESSDDER